MSINKVIKKYMQICANRGAKNMVATSEREIEI